MKVKITAITLLAIGLIGSTHAYAYDRDERPEGHPPGLPPEAIEACEGKQEGESVTVESPRGDTLEATCQMIDGELAALPNKPPRR